MNRDEEERDTISSIPAAIRKPAIHVLKTDVPIWEHVSRGDKNFEVRRNDRDYAIGDILVLEEWRGEQFTGQLCKRVVTYVLQGGRYGVQLGYVVLGLKEVF